MCTHTTHTQTQTQILYGVFFTCQSTAVFIHQFQQNQCVSQSYIVLIFFHVVGCLSFFIPGPQLNRVKFVLISWYIGWLFFWFRIKPRNQLQQRQKKMIFCLAILIASSMISPFKLLNCQRNIREICFMKLMIYYFDELSFFGVQIFNEVAINPSKCVKHKFEHRINK